jgi:hypothetical protein
MPLSAILTEWEFKQKGYRHETTRALANQSSSKIISNISHNIHHYLEYLALRPDVARRKFQWVLRDVWPYCLPYGRLLNKPNSLLVFCAPDDQKKLPYRNPNLPL